MTHIKYPSPTKWMPQNPPFSLQKEAKRRLSRFLPSRNYIGKKETTLSFARRVCTPYMYIRIHTRCLVLKHQEWCKRVVGYQENGPTWSKIIIYCVKPLITARKQAGLQDLVRTLLFTPQPWTRDFGTAYAVPRPSRQPCQCSTPCNMK